MFLAVLHLHEHGKGVHDSSRMQGFLSWHPYGATRATEHITWNEPAFFYAYGEDDENVSSSTSLSFCRIMRSANAPQLPRSHYNSARAGRQA
ncbi:hypothetical protein DAEQUDRAFT_731704 [Daedalea quercina L-15889]|uniref:Uncharacterized protein n=1 Tax=Daedalea quercina L-15889 TaxID=1314783 RepID=A0A165M3J7_9APHY|nr:hypothetical protein DAEQUDRAFT_731704 [Daedalea quercina L-15889]